MVQRNPKEHSGVIFHWFLIYQHKSLIQKITLSRHLTLSGCLGSFLALYFFPIYGVNEPHTMVRKENIIGEGFKSLAEVKMQLVSTNYVHTSPFYPLAFIICWLITTKFNHINLYNSLVTTKQLSILEVTVATRAPMVSEFPLSVLPQ